MLQAKIHSAHNIKMEENSIDFVFFFLFYKKSMFVY